MKSRYKKEMIRTKNKSNIIIFSKTKLYEVGSRVSKLENSTNVHQITLDFYDYVPKASERYDYIWSDLCRDLDNSLLTKGNFIYILKKLNKDTYEVVLEENARDWRDAYWSKEDPNNERDWSYIDEDVVDIYNYLQGKYAYYLSHKHKKIFKPFVQTELIYK